MYLYIYIYTYTYILCVCVCVCIIYICNIYYLLSDMSVHRCKKNFCI